MLKNGTVINYGNIKLLKILATKHSARVADELLYEHDADSLSAAKLLFTGESGSVEYEADLNVQHEALPKEVLGTIHWSVWNRALSEYAETWLGERRYNNLMSGAYFHYPLLFTASAIGATDVVWFLLSFQHLSVNQQSEEGDTPLHAAAANNQSGYG